MLELIVSMATSLSSLSIVAVTLAVIYGVKTWLSHPSDLPPMPRLPVPIMGHTVFMKPTPIKAIHNWRCQVGDIFTLYASGKPIVVLNNFQLITEAFVKQADVFSDRSITIKERLIGLDGTQGIVTNSQEPWKQQRTVAMSIFRSFGMGKNVMALKIAEEVDFYIQELSGFNGSPCNVIHLVNSALANVVCYILLGDRFHYEDPTFIRLLENIHNLFSLIEPSSPLYPFPFLRHLPGDLFGAKLFQQTYTEVSHRFGSHYINKFRANEDDTSDNFVKAYLREMTKRRNAKEICYLDESNLKIIITNLFLAGTETTGTTMMWAFVFAANYPEIQEKIFHEIEEAVGCHRVPSMQDKPGMNYLNAFIMETQRLGSIAPLGLFHKCSKTTQIGGYIIPEGATIFPNLDAVMKDPNNWENPDAFQPERFLDDDNKLKSLPHFVPFSLGRRACLGESLAKMELFLFLSATFQRFKVVPEYSDNPPSMESVFGLTASPKPFRVRFVARTWKTSST